MYIRLNDENYWDDCQDDIHPTNPCAVKQLQPKSTPKPILQSLAAFQIITMSLLLHWHSFE